MSKIFSPLLLALAMIASPLTASVVALEIEKPSQRSAANHQARASAKRNSKARERSKPQPKAPASRSQRKTPSNSRPAPSSVPQGMEVLHRRQVLLEKRVQLLTRAIESGRVPQMRESWGRRLRPHVARASEERKRLAASGFGKKSGGKKSARGKSGGGKSKARGRSGGGSKKGGKGGKGGGKRG